MRTLSIPSLKTGILITPYRQELPRRAEPAEPQYLLEFQDSHFLVSAKLRALVLALLEADGSKTRLEECFARESGETLPAERLLALAGKALPAALYAQAASAPRRTPFIVSATVLPDRIAAPLSALLHPLFDRRLAVCVFALFIPLQIAVLPAALAQVHSDWSALQTLQVFTLVVLGGLMHELGHTAACRHFNCPHGPIGLGLYFIFPAWYADVGKAWRLPPRQRAVVDVGGVYFDAILLIFVDLYALASGSTVALTVAWTMTFLMLFTLNPVFKFDGYWLLSDLSGLHNLHLQLRRYCTESLAKLFGRPMAAPGPARQTVIRWLLPAYAVLSAAYFVYFGIFLIHEAVNLATTLPAKLSLQWQTLAALAGHPGTLEFGVAVARMFGDIAWPLVVLAGAVFFAEKFWRALQDIRRGAFS